MIRILLCLFLGIASTRASMAAEAPAKPDAGESFATAQGVRYGLWPKRPAKPAPVVFVLAGGQEDTLSSKYFRQAAGYLIKEGVVCVSLDLPCHGADAQPTEKGLTGWRTRADKGQDFVADVTSRLCAVLDHLLEEGIADPTRIAALGTSRGGFIACHFAATDPRVKHVMAFAPLADLARLQEFSGAENLPLVQQLALEKQAAAMAGKSVWIVIGDRDDRVSTDSVIHAARAFTQATLGSPEPASVELHVIAEPRGHTVPQGYAEIGASWLRKKLSLPAVP